MFWMFGCGAWLLLNHCFSLACSVTKETASLAEWGCLAEASVTPHHQEDSSNTPVCSVRSQLVFFSDHLTDQNRLIVSTHPHCFLCNTYVKTPMETLMWQNKRSKVWSFCEKYMASFFWFFCLVFFRMRHQWVQQGCWSNRRRHSGLQRRKAQPFLLVNHLTEM